MIKLIAEIGINHNGSIETCKKLIDLASVAGFDYVKLQKRDIDLAVPEHKKNEPKSTPWGEMTYYDYKKKIEFSKTDYINLKFYAELKGLQLFASVWDVNSAKELSKHFEIVKIPSACIGNFELLKYCRENYKTVIMSTGMSTEEEIEKAMWAAKANVIMHTNSCYPSPIEDLNLEYIKWLKDKWETEVGYSGHEFGLSTTYPTIAMGVTWIERHITLDHDMWGSDQKASLDPIGCVKFVKAVRDIEKSMSGYGPREILNSEKSKRSDLKK